MVDIQTGATGGVAAIMGALATWFGLKGRVDRMETRVDKLADATVSASSCDKCKKDTDSRDAEITSRIGRLENTVNSGFQATKDDLRGIYEELRMIRGCK